MKEKLHRISHFLKRTNIASYRFTRSKSSLGTSGNFLRSYTELRNICFRQFLRQKSWHAHLVLFQTSENITLAGNWFVLKLYPRKEMYSRQKISLFNFFHSCLQKRTSLLLNSWKQPKFSILLNKKEYFHGSSRQQRLKICKFSFSRFLERDSWEANKLND